MSAVSPPRMSQDPLELVVEKLARLFQADAVGMLAVAPTSVLPKQESVVIANIGLPTATLAQLNCERLFPEKSLAPPARLLPVDLVEQISGSPAGIFLAAPVLDWQQQEVEGAVMLKFPPIHFEYERAYVAAALLANLTALEIERRKESQRLMDKVALVKALSVRHINRAEQEQKKLATEIHDDLSQNVTYLRLGLSSVERQLDAGLTERARNQVRELVKTSMQVSTSIQKVSTALRPSLIDTLGPIPAIRNEAALYTKSTGIVVECDLADVAMAGPVSLAMFRIVQAALSNIARHASASKVSIRLAAGSRTVTLSISDEGRGFDTHLYRNSLGLLAMIERAEIAGGLLSIHSQAGAGTRIVVTFPPETLA